MNISAIAQKRHTCKAYDKNKIISAEHLDQLCTLLHLCPSSVNSQPWHYLILSSDAAKEKALPGIADFNRDRVTNASDVIVFCVKKDLGDAHIQAILDQEDKDNRFANAEAKAANDKGRRYFFGLNSITPEQQKIWAEKQIYLAVGTLLLGAACLDIDATPIEGFDRTELDRCLDLEAKGLESVVIVSLGYKDDAEDFNAKLPKSRLPKKDIFTVL